MIARACAVRFSVQERLEAWGVQGAKDSPLVSACAAVALLNLRVILMDSANAIYNAFCVVKDNTGSVAPTAERMKDALAKAKSDAAAMGARGASAAARNRRGTAVAFSLNAKNLLAYNLESLVGCNMAEQAEVVFKVTKRLELLASDRGVPPAARRWAATVREECPVLVGLCSGTGGLPSIAKKFKVQREMDFLGPKVRGELELIAEAVMSDTWQLTAEHMARMLRRKESRTSAHHAIPQRVSLVVSGAPLLVATGSDIAFSGEHPSSKQVVFGSSTSPFVLIESSCSAPRVDKVLELGIRSSTRFA
jgi:hypothetical protein